MDEGREGLQRLSHSGLATRDGRVGHPVYRIKSSRDGGQVSRLALHFIVYPLAGPSEKTS
jgi:hypothetical protein